jgi:putative ABC transport system permease protein
VFRQIDFARHIDLGLNRDNVVVTGTGGRLTPEGLDSFQHALERGPGIVAVARSNRIPFDSGNDVLPVQKPGDASFLSPTHIAVSPEYFRLFGIRILAGRNLSDKRADDVFHDLTEKDYAAKDEGHNLMVNVSLARALGYAPADIVGKSFIFGKSHMTVVGVAADTLDGVRSPVQQLAYVYAPDRAQNLVIRVQAGRTQEAVDYVTRVTRAFIHGVSLSPSFLDDSYERLYRGDKRQGQIFGIFVAIAIVIACLGLFGLAAFAAERRTREIGVRKVFGARALQIVWLLLTQFSAPVLLANLIAWPLAWYYLDHWLQGFAYRVPLSPLYFVGVGLMALLIAWATVFGHALRVARASPIRALRYE